MFRLPSYGPPTKDLQGFQGKGMKKYLCCSLDCAFTDQGQWSHSCKLLEPVFQHMGHDPKCADRHWDNAVFNFHHFLEFLCLSLGYNRDHHCCSRSDSIIRSQLYFSTSLPIWTWRCNSCFLQMFPCISDPPCSRKSRGRGGSFLACFVSHPGHFLGPFLFPSS